MWSVRVPGIGVRGRAEKPVVSREHGASVEERRVQVAGVRRASLKRMRRGEKASSRLA